MVEWSKVDLASLVAPEMADVPDAVFDEVAALVAERLSPRVFPEGTHVRKFAGLYLIAHTLAICPPAGVAVKGPAVSAESAGEVSVSYAVQPLAGDDLALSPYGIQFRRLARSRTGGGLVA